MTNPIGFIANHDGTPMRVKFVDKRPPGSVTEGVLEVRPGGMVVYAEVEQPVEMVDTEGQVLDARRQLDEALQAHPEPVPSQPAQGRVATVRANDLPGPRQPPSDSPAATRPAPVQDEVFPGATEQPAEVAPVEANEFEQRSGTGPAPTTTRNITPEVAAVMDKMRRGEGLLPAEHELAVQHNLYPQEATTT
jgi:hypothetical protein